MHGNGHSWNISEKEPLVVSKDQYMTDREKSLPYYWGNRAGENNKPGLVSNEKAAVEKLNQMAILLL